MQLPIGTKVRVAHYGDEKGDGKVNCYRACRGNLYEITAYLQAGFRSETPEYVEIKGPSGRHEMYVWRIEPVGVEHESTEL